jgi:hypothetical protein
MTCSGRSPGSRVITPPRLPGPCPKSPVAYRRRTHRLQLRAQLRIWPAIDESKPHRIPFADQYDQRPKHGHSKLTRAPCQPSPTIAYRQERKDRISSLEHHGSRRFRNPKTPNIIRIQHHKTRAIVLHPLEEKLPDGTVIKFYEDAEAVLSHLKKRGTPMILREIDEDKFKPFSFSGMKENRTAHAKGAGATNVLYAGRLSTWRTDRTRGSGVDGRPGAARSRRTGLRNPMKDMLSGTCRARCRLPGNGMPMCWRTHQKQSVRMRPWRAVRMKIRQIQKVTDFIG